MSRLSEVRIDFATSIDYPKEVSSRIALACDVTPFKSVVRVYDGSAQPMA